MDARSSGVNDAELPALHRAADTISAQGQRRYLQLFSADLVLLAAGALLASISVPHEGALRCLRILAAIVLGAGVLVTVLLRSRNYEQAWYGGRAVAESVKSMAWRYMMGAERYGSSLQPSAVDRLFVDDLREVLDQRRQLAVPLAATGIAADIQITDHMRKVREAPLPDRRQIYARDRIENQRSWYAEKACCSADLESRWFGFVIVAQTLAVLAAILLVFIPSFQFNAAAFFSAVTAVLLSWLQMRRYQELAQSYNVAAIELGVIGEMLATALSESEFSVFVSDAESAISREHTLWVARRDRAG